VGETPVFLGLVVTGNDAIGPLVATDIHLVKE
jgi:hypothetical protein